MLRCLMRVGSGYFAFSLLCAAFSGCDLLGAGSGAATPSAAQTCESVASPVAIGQLLDRQRRSLVVGCASGKELTVAALFRGYRNPVNEFFGASDPATADAKDAPTVLVKFADVNSRWHARDTSVLPTLEQGTPILIHGTVAESGDGTGSWLFRAEVVERVAEKAADPEALARVEPVSSALRSRNKELATAFAAAVKADTPAAYLAYIENVQALAAKELGFGKHPAWQAFVDKNSKFYDDNYGKKPPAGKLSSPMQKALVYAARYNVPQKINEFAFAIRNPGGQDLGLVLPGQYPHVFEAFVRLGRKIDPKGGDFDGELGKLLQDVELGDASKQNQALGTLRNWQLGSAAQQLLALAEKQPGIKRSLALMDSTDDATQERLSAIASQAWRESKCEQSDVTWGRDYGCDVIQAVPLHHPTPQLVAAVLSRPLRSRGAVITLLALGEPHGLKTAVLKGIDSGDWQGQQLFFGLKYLFRLDDLAGKQAALALIDKHHNDPNSAGFYGDWRNTAHDYVAYVGPALDEAVSDAAWYKTFALKVLAQDWADSDMQYWMAFLAPKLGSSVSKPVPFPEIATRALAGMKTPPPSIPGLQSGVRRSRCGWLLVATYFDLGPDVAKYKSYLADSKSAPFAAFLRDPVNGSCY